MRPSFALALQVCGFVMPWAVRRRWLRLLGWELEASSRIGFSFILADRVRLGPGARVGHLCFVSRLAEIRFGRNSTMGPGNRVFGNVRKARYDGVARYPALILGEEASITAFHIVDCIDTVTIGDFSILAGFQSQVLTHAVDFEQNRQISGKTTIGSHCFVGTRCIILRGAFLPDRSVLAAGSVLSRAYEATGMLYGGVPAKQIKPLKGAYFLREKGATL